MWSGSHFERWFRGRDERLLAQAIERFQTLGLHWHAGEMRTLTITA
jgi:hypothetical protein